MEENEFEFDGKTYVSRHKAKSMSRCQYCAFSMCFECIDDESAIPQCVGCYRIDGRDVIFVEKQQ